MQQSNVYVEISRAYGRKEDCGWDRTRGVYSLAYDASGNGWVGLPKLGDAALSFFLRRHKI